MKHILDRTSFAELRELFERAQKAKEYARHNPPMEKRADAIRFDRNVRYARNECNHPLAEYGFRRTASVPALSVRRKENNGIMLFGKE